MNTESKIGDLSRERMSVVADMFVCTRRKDHQDRKNVKVGGKKELSETPE